MKMSITCLIGSGWLLCAILFGKALPMLSFNSNSFFQVKILMINFSRASILIISCFRGFIENNNVYMYIM